MHYYAVTAPQKLALVFFPVFLVLLLGQTILPMFEINDIAYATSTKLTIVSGIASGDVTDSSAVIWSRANAQSYMNVEYDIDPNFTNPQHKKTSFVVNKTSDFAANIKLDNLSSNTTYYYRVWFSGINDPSIRSPSETGRFKTAPDHLASGIPLSFVAGGDLGGQQYCRRVDLGYPIFDAMSNLRPNFFIFIGDQIYGDEYCTEKGPTNASGWNNIPGEFRGVLHQSVDWNNYTQVRDLYDKHWAYNRADNRYQQFLKEVPIYSQADDHEVANNWGNWSYFNNATKERGSFYNLVKAGLDAFFSYSPIERNQSDPYRMYRSFSWGKDLDMFILDAHSYRSRNDLPDTYANKTLYGREQLAWLEQSLLNSTATWKIIVNSVPVTIPLCSKGGPFGPTGCDNWATTGANTPFSFSEEREKFFNFIVENNIKNVVFITTDVHFAANIRFQIPLDSPESEKLTIYELVSGPLSAKRQLPPLLDPTIDASYMYNETGIFNFAYYKIQRGIDGKVHLISQVYDINGLARPGSYIDLVPE